MPQANQYQSYFARLTATGGTPPYTWSVVQVPDTSLPEGMSLNPATGVVSATQVNGMGGYAVTIQVADSGSPSPAVATTTLNFGVVSDSSYGGCQMFPPDSIYNQRIDKLPVDTNPSHQIPSAYLSSPIHPDFGQGFYPGPGGIPFMRVAANQPTTNVNVAGSGQIDSAGTYTWPFPAWPNAAIEDTANGIDGNDHHILVLQSSVNNLNGPQTGPCILYETYQSTAVPSMFDAGSNTWFVSGAVHYVLSSNEIAASTSTLDSGAQDSPGIPMVPLLMRYSEVPLGVQHPLRIAFPSPTNWFVWPGTGCCAGSGPPQGLLYRLKASVNWQTACPVSTNPQAATVLQAMQQYGAYMSDHGGTGYVGGAPDVRWDDDDLACIKKFHVSDLEVVDNSALEVSDLSGQTKPYVVPAVLPHATLGTAYTATFSAVGGNPGSLRWSVSSGALPPGLLLNTSTGTISGMTTSSTGSPFSFGITATDMVSGYASQAQNFSIAVTLSSSIIAVTVTSAPAGLSVTVDGTAYTVPQTFNWLQGSSHTVSAPSLQGTGTRYAFANWSDAGAQSHTVVPSAAITYTANFTTQYLLVAGVSPSGAGAIAANPNSTDGYYNSGTIVQLTATPGTGRAFSAFSGDLTGATNPQSVVISSPRVVTATFAQLPALLGIAVTNTGTFARGQTNATYTVTVSNVSSQKTSGTVTVSEAVPVGMTLVSMAGTGWSCPLGGSACTRGDTLGAGASYPSINVTVSVAATAASPLLNAVNVSGGGSATANAIDSTSLTSLPPNGSATGVATFVKTDISTAGTWKGVYGADGFNVFGDTASVPAYVAITPSGNLSDVWVSSTTDPRGLQTPSTPGHRIAACWYSAGSMNIDLAFNDTKTHQVAFYLVDWDGGNRTEELDILDANNNLLDARSVASFFGGQYLAWNLSGHVIVRITNTHPGLNAVVSGLFFDAAGSVQEPAPPPTVTFVTADNTTAGTWKGVYGADGYNVIGNAVSVPAYVTITPSGNNAYVFAPSTIDPRALQTASTSGNRIAACWYTGGAMNIDMAFNDANTHQVAIYLLDWDYYGRSEKIDILDANNNVLDTRSAASFAGGQYLVWNLRGHVILRITNTASNAVISGLFFR